MTDAAPDDDPPPVLFDNLITREPVAVYMSFVAATVSVVLAAARWAGWLILDDEQLAAAVATVVSFAMLVVAGLRPAVVSPASWARSVNRALQTPPPSPPLPAVRESSDDLDLPEWAVDGPRAEDHEAGR